MNSSPDEIRQQIAAQIANVKGMIANDALNQDEVLQQLNALSQMIVKYVGTSFVQTQQLHNSSVSNEKAKYDELKKLFENSLNLWSGLTSQIDVVMKQK